MQHSDKTHNKRMQLDFGELALPSATDAGRYKAPVGNKLKKAIVRWCQTEVTQI